MIFTVKQCDKGHEMLIPKRAQFIGRNGCPTLLQGVRSYLRQPTRAAHLSSTSHQNGSQKGALLLQIVPHCLRNSTSADLLESPTHSWYWWWWTECFYHGFGFLRSACGAQTATPTKCTYLLWLVKTLPVQRFHARPVSACDRRGREKQNNSFPSSCHGICSHTAQVQNLTLRSVFLYKGND